MLSAYTYTCTHARFCVDAIVSSKFVCMCVKYRRDGHARWTTSPADVFSQSYSAASTCCRACVRKSTSKRLKLSWESASPRFFFARPRLFVRHGLSKSAEGGGIRTRWQCIHTKLHCRYPRRRIYLGTRSLLTNTSGDVCVCACVCVRVR
jgi:hypothetical protein